eukprot:jgi/Picsp_1/3324/NSC_06163-R1_tudor domain-containing protein 3 isoform 1
MAQDIVRSFGWYIRDESLEKEAAGDLQHLLDSDLRKIGSPSLPADINSIVSQSLEEPLILQIVSSMDASIPTKCSTVCKDGKKKMLLLRLTDGWRECRAMEYHHVPALQQKVLIPGMKIRLVGAAVRYGMILLSPNSVELLGGYVKELAEAFEAQVLYGDLAKERKGKLGETENPPRFQHFDPSRRRRPLPTVSKDPRDSVRKCTHIDGGNSNRTKSKPPFGSERKETTIPVIDDEDKVSIPAASSKINAVAAESLLKKMEKKAGESRKGREGRRRARHEERLSAPKITLDEWEAKKGGMQAPGSEICSDHELAVSMQNQFDLEDCKGASSAGLQTELLGMFYSENTYNTTHAPRGRRPSSSRGKGRRGQRR